VHEVEGEQAGGKQRIVAAAEQLFAEGVHYRYHGYSEQRSYYSPAEGVHAEYGNSQHDEYLAEGRVRVLVWGYAVQVFVGRAAVVQFVKVHSVQVRRSCRYLLRLVHKSLRPFGRSGFYYIAVAVEQGDLIYPYPALRYLYAYLIGINRVIATHGYPAEHIVVLLNVFYALPVAEGKSCPSLIYSAEYPYLAYLLGAFEGYGRRITNAAYPVILRRLRCAEVRQGDYGVHQRQGKAVQPVPQGNDRRITLYFIYGSFRLFHSFLTICGIYLPPYSHAPIDSNHACKGHQVYHRAYQSYHIILSAPERCAFHHHKGGKDV